MTQDQQKEVYDFIILGGGASGLSMACELADSGKSILVLEKEKKANNDRTWSFWEKGEGKYDSIVTHRWNKISFHANSSYENLDIGPYQYKMIRSSDFYKHCDDYLKAFDNVRVIQDDVLGFVEMGLYVDVRTENITYRANIVLDSISKPTINKEKTPFVWQHFGGWFIKTKKPIFNAGTAVFMDFRIPQADDTRFFYVLPSSENEALVEIAIFSNDIWKAEEYDQQIHEYIEKYLDITDFEVVEKEIGMIPMTSYNFEQHNTERIIKIGTSGGWVKPSSGYAFKRILDRSPVLAKQLLNNQKPDVASSSLHKWMDKTMLKAILNNYVSGKDVFESLFKKRKASEVFEFLDEENSLFQDIKFMYSAPIIPFTRSAFVKPW